MFSFLSGILGSETAGAAGAGAGAAGAGIGAGAVPAAVGGASALGGASAGAGGDSALLSQLMGMFHSSLRNHLSQDPASHGLTPEEVRNLTTPGHPNAITAIDLFRGLGSPQGNEDFGGLLDTLVAQGRPAAAPVPNPAAQQKQSGGGLGGLL